MHRIRFKAGMLNASLVNGWASAQFRRVPHIAISGVLALTTIGGVTAVQRGWDATLAPRSSSQLDQVSTDETLSNVASPPDDHLLPMPTDPAPLAQVDATTAAAEVAVPSSPTVAAEPQTSQLAPTPEPVRTYRVLSGDTLASIAAANGLRMETLLWANNLADPALLQPDQELRVPSVDGVLYTLRPGDTLRDIADRAGEPVTDILAVNPLPDPDRVSSGTEVLIPAASPAQLGIATGAEQDLRVASTGQPKSVSSAPKPSPVTYEVQPGDTLGSLESKFGIDLPTLLTANDIADPDSITPGTTLRILPVSGVEHKVQPGERLSDIAAQYQTLLGLIVDFNGIADPDLVRPGDRLVIPGGRRQSAPAVTAKPAVIAKPQVAPPAPASANPARPAAAPTPDVAPTATPVAPTKPDRVTVAPPSGPLGQRIASIALQFNGAPYVWGGTSPAGFDCSGLVWYVGKQSGAPLSRGLWGQYNAGAHVSRAGLQPGDLVFFQNTYMPGLSHNGVYLGGGRFIHAVDENSGVRISNIDDAYWTSRWFGATRVAS